MLGETQRHTAVAQVILGVNRLGSVCDMKRGDYTDMGGTGAAFLTTHWSLVEQVGSDQALIGSLTRTLPGAAEGSKRTSGNG